MAHTPGPWHADDQLRVLDANDNEVSMPSIGAQLLEAVDNARLIAAAPDLLAALKLITDYQDGLPDLDADGEAVAENARAAIAKAEDR